MKIKETAWDDFVKNFPSAIKLDNATYFYCEDSDVGFVRDNDSGNIDTYMKDTNKVKETDYSVQDDFDILLALAPKLRDQPVDDSLDENLKIDADDMYTSDINELYSYEDTFNRHISFKSKVKKFVKNGIIGIILLLFIVITALSIYVMKMF